MALDSNLPDRDWLTEAESQPPEFFGTGPQAEHAWDHWLEEALRAIPLPSGLIERMIRVAQPAHDERQWTSDPR